MADPAHALRAWLDRTLAEAAPGTRLPTRSDLARRFGLARATVNRVVAAYGDRIAAHPGKGSCVGGFPGPAMPSAEAGLRVSDRILERLWAGELRRGQRLPPLKELGRRLGVSERALGRACRDLAQRGVLSPSGRGFVVGGDLLGSPRRQGRVILVYPQDDAGDAFADGPQQRALVATEDELAHHHLVVEPQSRRVFAATLEAWATGRERPAAGVIFSGLDLGDEALIADLAHRLARLRPRPSLLFSGRRQRELPAGTAMFCVGTIVTRLMRGIAQLACLSGVRRVRLVLSAARAWKGRRLAEFLRLIPEMKAQGEEIGLEIVLERCSAWRDPRQAVADLTRVHGFERAYLQAILDKFGHTDLDRVADGIRISTDPLAAAEQADETLLVLDAADQAVAIGSALRRRGGDLPGRTQILCLDDGLLPRRHGIATLLPDWDGIGFLMAQSLVPGLALPKTRRGYLAIPTRFLPRGTMRVVGLTSSD